MGGRRLYIQLLAAVLVSGLAALLPLAWTGGDALQSSYRESAVQDMIANAHLFSLAASPHLSEENREALPALARKAQADSHARFTVIAGDGAVIADSEEDANRMENHAGRPEIRQAMAGGTGVDVRKSPTLGTDWIYAAIPVRGGIVIRAAASLDKVDFRLAQWWKKAALGFVVSLALLAALALFVAGTLARPLEIAAAGADRYAKGDFSHRIPVSGSAEMRRLALSLTAMADELDTRFRQIERQGREMRAVFANMTEGVLAVDGQGRIMLVNGAAEAMLDLPSGATGKNLAGLLRHPGLLDAVRTASTSDSPLESEIGLANRTGGETLVNIHSTVIRDAEKTMGVLIVLRDVTRIRKLEIMRRDFVANVSHELRTPVTAIQGSLETLLDGGMDDAAAARTFLHMAVRNARRLGKIIGNLLLLAGMESGKRGQDGEASPHRIRPVLEEALAACGESAAERRVVFVTQYDGDVSARMDPHLVVHALVNLLDNAIKYGPDGGAVTIAVTADHENARIVITDEGPGIEPRHRSRVFERFYRVDGSSRAREGSGLGLSLVRHIAMAQGGSIRLESDTGKGCAFILSLPVA